MFSNVRAPSDVTSLVKLNQDFPVVRSQFDEDHRKQSDLIADLFEKAIKQMGTSFDKALDVIYKTNHEHQDFVAKCRIAMLEEVRKRKDNPEGAATIDLYISMMRASMEGGFSGTSRTIELAIQLHNLGLQTSLTLIDKALDVKSRLVIQEKDRVETLVRRNEAMVKVEIEAKKFVEEQWRLNLQQKAEILQKQYDSLIEVYKLDLEVAKNVLAQNPTGFRIDSIPPRIEGEKVYAGRVSFSNVPVVAAAPAAPAIPGIPAIPGLLGAPATPAATPAHPATPGQPASGSDPMGDIGKTIGPAIGSAVGPALGAAAASACNVQ